MFNRPFSNVLTRLAVVAAILATLLLIAPAASAAVATQSFTYAENGTDPIARFVATDDEGDDITWSLGGADKGDFSISGAGVLAFKKSPNFESPADAGENNVYNVDVTATGNQTTTQPVQVTVTDVDEAGKVTLDKPQPQVSRGLTATQSDPDGTSTDVTWQWSRGPNMDGPWTVIAKATSDSHNPTEDDLNSYLRAVATYTDKFGSDKTAEAVSENPVEAKTVANAAPSFADQDEDDIPATITVTREVDENKKGVVVGKPVSAKDADNDILLYKFTAEDDDFSIDERSGQIKTKKALDANTAGRDSDDRTDTVTVRATDPSGAFTDQLVTITITDVNDAPTFDSKVVAGTAAPTTISIAENTTALGADAAARTYTAKDDDTGDDTFLYSVSGADASSFSITASTTAAANGVLSIKKKPNFETKSSYSITITAEDGDGATGSVNVTVKVTNANDAGEVRLSQREPQVDAAVVANLTDEDGGVNGIVWSWLKATLSDQQTCGSTGVNYTAIPNSGFTQLHADFVRQGCVPDGSCHLL